MLHRFRVRTRTPFTVEVVIWSTLGAMRDGARRWERTSLPVQANRSTWAETRRLLGIHYTVTERRNRPDRTGRPVHSRLAAVIFLAKTHLSGSTIVHECFHATMNLGGRCKLGVLDLQDRYAASPVEECLAGIHDRLVRDVLIQLRHRRLLAG